MKLIFGSISILYNNFSTSPVHQVGKIVTQFHRDVLPFFLYNFPQILFFSGVFSSDFAIDVGFKSRLSEGHGRAFTIWPRNQFYISLGFGSLSCLNYRQIIFRKGHHMNFQDTLDICLQFILWKQYLLVIGT